jgi:hypothetical protein
LNASGNIELVRLVDVPRLDFGDELGRLGEQPVGLLL